MEDMFIVLVLLLILGFYWELYITPRIFEIKQKINTVIQKVFALF